MREEQRRKLEEKKYAIEVAHVRKVWEEESRYVDYFEEKHGRYLDNKMHDENRIEKEYLEMYDLEDYNMEEGGSI